ncbi:alpha/beta hydrolase [Pseudorhodoferax soli]|uniref:Acetyl esterase/lipase n=1 Tax=Pseudorhodoferax soli TaxID=545864 RepID=A0A368XCN8_9BURK|nr:alpha/beta hydrolase [Pseudorhodoferax soli]RCW64768.1 acetyl esterase/lipase [Pseudorhodoferax soli]
MAPHTPDDILVEDIAYQRQGDAPLLLRLYRPRGPGPFPLLAEVHGGAWCRGDRLDEDRLNCALAARGIVVAALDFRMPPQAAYPASLADINLAVRWLKAQAATWGCDAAGLGLMGLSSGAHQAMLTAMRPHDPRYAALPLEGGEGLDARAAFAVLCWPVIDPLGRYRYAREWQDSGRPVPETIGRVLPDHLRYWGGEDAMAEGNPVLALERGEAVALPPVLVLQGDADLVHPRAQLERFAQAYGRAGGEIALQWFEGEAEGFVNKKPDAPSTARAIDAIAHFVHQRSGSTVPAP